MNRYAYLLVRSADRNNRTLIEAITDSDHALLKPATPWGLFRGLFGIGSNEVVVVLSGDDEALDAAERQLGRLEGVSIASSYRLEPTVKPTDPSPLTTPGLYVLRFFDIDHGDVDEIAALSSEAWLTFTNPDGYQAEPYGLFCEADRTKRRGTMLLVTWYDGFGSWEASRSPAPEARANFQRRYLLTAGTRAYATRLITA